MDRVWSQRAMPYKVCMVSLMFGICPFGIGFVTPDWLWFQRRGENGTEIEGSFGLWELCETSGCESNPLVGNPVVDDWFIVVVIFQTIALPFYVCSLISAILQNFGHRRWLRTIRLQRLRQILHKDSETPEDLAFVAGFMSFLGIILFMIMTSEVVSHGARYSWGFALSFTGATILVTTGLLMCKAHAPILTQATVNAVEPTMLQTFSMGRTRRNNNNNNSDGRRRR